MQWKERVIGALVTLTVTVTAGVSVYWFNKVPTQQEHLAFQFDPPLVFDTEATKRSFLSVRAGNFGDLPAKNVHLGLSLPPGLTIADKKVSLSSGPAATFDVDSKTPGELSVVVPVLLPNETATATLMIDGVLKVPPFVAMRSDASAGTAGPFTKVTQEAGTAVFAVRLLPIIAGLQVLLLTLLSQRFRGFMRRLLPTFANPNNTAFLYIHRGLIDEAEQLLRASISQRGADAITLANYGLVLGLSGRGEDADLRLEAAAWYAGMKHERAVVAFNRAVLGIVRNDLEAAKQDLTEALRLSRIEILRYCAFSIYIQRALDSDVELKQLVAAGRPLDAGRPTK